MPKKNGSRVLHLPRNVIPPGVPMTPDDKHTEFIDTVYRVAKMFQNDADHEQIWWAAVLRRAAQELHPLKYGGTHKKPNYSIIRGPYRKRHWK